MMFFYFPVLIFLLIFSILPVIFVEKRRTRNGHKQNKEKNSDIGDYFPSQVSELYSDKWNIHSLTGEIFRLADKRNGRITISDVIIQTGLSIKDAEKVMNNLVDGQLVCMEVNEKGWIIYEFPQIINRRKTFKEDVIESEEKNQLINE